jgi:hypothetical protein
MSADPKFKAAMGRASDDIEVYIFQLVFHPILAYVTNSLII